MSLGAAWPDEPQPQPHRHQLLPQHTPLEIGHMPPENGWSLQGLSF